MKKFTIIEHVADIRLHVQASTLQDLFSASLEGMSEIINPGHCQKHQNILSYTITLSSIDTTVLLIDFLSEVLTLCHLNKAIFCSATFKSIEQKSLNVTVHGFPLSRFQEDIKAVTYHEAEIIEENGILSTVIVFDI